MRKTRPSIAVDIVLLLPPAISRRAIAASRRLGSKMRLGRGALPHITLAMGAVRHEALPLLVASLHTLAKARGAPPVTIERAVGLPGSRHVKAWYEIARSRELLALHRAAMWALVPHRRPRVTSAGFHGGHASPSSRRFVRHFEDHAFRKYRPHITLGYGKPPVDPALPATVHASRLALCHLGDHCTCAKALWEGRLQPPAVAASGPGVSGTRRDRDIGRRGKPRVE